MWLFTSKSFLSVVADEEAVEADSKALFFKPDYAQAYYNRGNTLKAQGNLEEAMGAYNKAIAIKPDYVGAKHMADSLSGNTKKTTPRDYVLIYSMHMPLTWTGH